MHIKKPFIILSLALMSFSFCALANNGAHTKEIIPESVEMPYVGQVEAAKPAYVPTDTNYQTLVNSYHMSSNGIGDIERTWDRYKGDSIKVAIIDNGIDMDHPDFKDTYGNSIINSKSMYIKGNDLDNKITYYTLDRFPTCLNHNYDVASSSNHGTNVAATLAAAINGVGGVGIAPNVDLYIYRTAYRYYEVQYALQQCLAEGIDVVNMSFEASSSGWANLRSDFQKLYNAGTILVAAAGNSNVSTNTYPAHTQYVVGVGALEDNQLFEIKASYSNYNSESTPGINNVDIAAPGQVYVADGSGNGTHKYKDTHGTSFASPIVAGVAALWKDANHDGSASEFENELYTSATKLGGVDWSQNFGYGRVDIGNLLSNYVPVTGVSIDEGESLSLEVDEELQLHATVTPSDATDKSVMWISNDEDICTVDEDTGLVHAVKEGTTEVGVLTNDGYFDDYIEVTVKNPKPVIKEWLLVENISQLAEGSIITFTGDDQYVTGVYSTSYLKSVNGSVFSSDKKKIDTLASGATQYILGKSGSNWTISQIISTGNKLLGATANKTLTLGNASAKNIWTISINDNAFATVANTETSYGRILYNYNNGNPRFCNYTSAVSSTMKLPKIYVFDSQEEIKVTGVNLAPSSSTLEIGSTVQLTASVLPSNATNKNVSWSSNNNSVATVDQNGLVTAVSSGNATITVKTEDGGFKATCSITVLAAPTLTGIELSGTPTNDLVFGSSFVKSSIKVTAKYNRGSDKDVTSSAVINLPNTKILGSQQVEVSYTENGITKNAFYSVNVTNVGSAATSKKATLTMDLTKSGTISSSNIKDYYSFSAESGFGISKNEISGSLAAETNNGIKFASGSKSGSWKITLNKSYPVIKVVLLAKVYGSDGSSITVNGVSKEAPSSFSNVEFDINSASTSSVSISAASGKRFYIKSIEILYGGGAPTTYTYEEQATAWSNFFMQETNKYCDITGKHSDIANLKVLWTTLKTEYVSMASGSKTYFVSELSSSESMQRYETIIQRYGSQGFDEFITDGNNVMHIVTKANTFDLFNNESTNIIVILIPILVLGIGLAVIAYKTKKEN